MYYNVSSSGMHYSDNAVLYWISISIGNIVPKNLPQINKVFKDFINFFIPPMYKDTTEYILC